MPQSGPEDHSAGGGGRPAGGSRGPQAPERAGERGDDRHHEGRGWTGKVSPPAASAFFFPCFLPQDEEHEASDADSEHEEPDPASPPLLPHRSASAAPARSVLLPAAASASAASASAAAAPATGAYRSPRSIMNNLTKANRQVSTIMSEARNIQVNPAAAADGSASKSRAASPVTAAAATAAANTTNASATTPALSTALLAPNIHALDLAQDMPLNLTSDRSPACLPHRSSAPPAVPTTILNNIGEC